MTVFVYGILSTAEMDVARGSDLLGWLRGTEV